MLTAKKKALAELMVNEPKLSNVEYAKRIGIDPKTLYKWKKTVEFEEYLTELCRDKFKGLEAIAIDSLKKNALKGNQKAIEYILNYCGYQATQKVEVSETVISVDIEE